MDKTSIWKWIILIALTSWSISSVTPIKDKIKLGLDLKGGTRYVLQVDKTGLNADAARDAVPRALEVIRNRVDSMGVAEPVIYTEPGDRIVVEIPGLNPADRDRALKNIQSAAYLEFKVVHAKNDDFVAELFTKGLAPQGYKIVSVADKRSGGLWDYKEYFTRDPSKDPEGVTEEQIRERVKIFQAPTGYELLLNEEAQGNQKLYRPYFVNKRAELTGESLANAGYDYDQLMRPHVTLKFDSRGAKRFGTLTADLAPGGAKNPNPQERRQLAIVLDGTLYSAPSIKDAIYGGSAIIEGNFQLKEAQDLSIVLRAGALPAPVKLLEERTVAPTLGEDSIRSGKRAVIFGVGAVAVFMILYYTLAGAIANVALLMNLILLPIGLMITAGLFSIFSSGQGGAMSLPTLTLPGIAGIALTIGMAVDANVLIFERMREEQAAGKRFKAVVAAGYDKAFSAIFDSNLTTLISASILFWQGTGSVRGYAVTLSAGIIVSMYTALMVTRMIFDIIASKTNVQTLKMLHILKAPNYNFLKMKTICAVLSLAVILGSWSIFIKRGKDNFGVDFTGGAAITYTFTDKIPTEKLRDALTMVGVSDATIQYQVVGPGGDKANEHLEIKVASEESQKTTSALTTAFPSAGYSVLKEDNVGPQIGAELQKKAIIATLLSFIGIIIYVSIRFEFPFAMGAVVALLHDVLVAIGVYCALGNQLKVTMVAAVLTIIGYSVNDTIVIFDRIREQLKLYPGKKFAEVANDSMNQCLSRTLLTSFATMLTVVALLVWGGGDIKDFSLLLFIGMVSGVYSTVYVAAPVVLLWHREKKPAAAKL